MTKITNYNENFKINGSLILNNGTQADGYVLTSDSGGTATWVSQSTLTGGTSSGSTLFTADIVVSLSGGKTLGKYLNGQTIPASGKTAQQVITDIAIEDIAPTYTPATNVLIESEPPTAEVGTSYSNNLTATFTQNDAGLLSFIKIQKDGVDMSPTGTTSPLSTIDSGNTYPNATVTYIAYCNYASGVTKNYMPSGTPDPRTPQIRSVNAPQAAENGFPSNAVTITGLYNIFYGPSSSAPSNSAAVRALPNNRFTNAGNVFILNTGSVDINFSVAMPDTLTISNVTDLDALNANITANYILSVFTVNDAGGSPVSYNVYTMTNAVPYASNHRHQITVV